MREKIPKRRERGEVIPSSQRLRAVMYIIWEKHGSVGKFEDKYNAEMEKIISHYKKKYLGNV